MFEEEIKEYESVRQEYQQKIADKMGREQWMEYNESVKKQMVATTTELIKHIFFNYTY